MTGTREATSSPPEEAFACDALARGAPLAIAVSMVAAALVAALRVDPGGLLPHVGVVRGLLVAVGAIAGLRVVLSSNEVRIRAKLQDRSLRLELSSRSLTLDYDAIRSLDWDHAFRYYSRWIPALVVVDARGERHRVPAVLRGGDRFVASLAARSGRRDLRGLAAALGLAERMRRARRLLPVAYAAAALLLLAAVLT